MRVTPPSARMALATVVSFALLALAASTAFGNVVHTGSGEPTFTKGTSNTWFFNWSNPGSSHYYVCFQLSKDGASVNAENTDCYDKGSALSGTQKETATGLQSGHYYTMEAHSYYLIAGGIYGSMDTDDAQTTTIDNSVPSAVAGVDGTATYTNNPDLQLHVAYSDSISWPWPSTFDCIQKGSPCATLNYDPNCSAANVFHGLVNSFDCHSNVSSVANHDGKWYFCTIESDSAIPDNPTNSNQFTATSDKANLSSSNCGYVTLDTTAPTESPVADHTTVTTGQLVNFTAASTDSSSGVNPNAYTWSFGDNTAGAAGPSVGHTYASPGTYQATLTGKDNAGNTGTGHVTITVNAPSSPPPPPPVTGSGGTGGSGTGTGTGSAGSGSTGTGGGSLSNSPGAITTTTISQLAGGGSTQHSSLGGHVTVLAPRTFRAGLKSLVLALTASGPGKASAALTRAGRIYSKKSAHYRSAGTYSLKLKMRRKIKLGTYKLKVTFVPAGSTHGRTKTLKVKIVKPRPRHKKMVQAPGRVTVTGGPVLRVPTL